MRDSVIFSALKVKTFRSLWAATLGSNFGTIIQAVGAGWLMSLLTDSESLIALVQTAVTLPILLFSLLAGVLADGFDRRKVMLAAQFIMLALSLVLAILTLSGAVTPWSLLGLTFLVGCGTALHGPSWQASVGDLVPREVVPAAVAANAMGFNVVRSIGPAIGGAIVAAAGAGLAFAINALSYCGLIAALWRWTPPPRQQSLPRESFATAFSDGLRYLAMSPNLVLLVTRSGLFGLAAISVQALLPVIVRAELGGNALMFGILLGCFGAGAVMGGLVSGRLRQRLSTEHIVRFAFLGSAVSTAIVAVSHNAVLTGIALVFSGGCWLICMALFNTTVQLSTPRWVVGRALSQFQMAAFGGMAVGSWLWGFLAEQAGLLTSMLCSAAVLALGGLLGIWLPLRNTADTSFEPHDRFRKPSVQLDLSQRSGPILIMVEYQIAQSDVDAFLAAMTERRRSRKRDGARNWSLLRDLEQPERWVESYHLPTWIEYLRHQSRRTLSDAEISDRLMSLHRGPTPLVIHRMIERPTVPKRDDAPPRMTPSPYE